MAAYRRLPSGLWQASVRLPDGRRRTRTDLLKGTVRKWAEDAEHAIRRGEWADPQDGRITLGQWYRDWTRTRLIETATLDRDASHWRTHVEPRWGSVRLMAVTTIDVETWIADMDRAKVGRTAASQSVRLLRHMLSDAARHRIIGSDPTASVRLPKIPKHVDRFLSRDEFEALLAHLPCDRDRAMCLLAGLCGLRWGEVAGLHAHRVDLSRRQLLVVEVLRRNGTVKDVPKSQAGQRLVPMPDRVADTLEPFVGSGLLFSGMDYTNWRRRVFVPSVGAAGLATPLPTYHSLRHSYGSWLAGAGVPPHDIMALMGHGSLRATERYLHSGSERFGKALAAMSLDAIGS